MYLGEQMRSKILSRLKEMGEPQAELYNLFREIDDNGNGNLSRDEFATFMNAIEINFSRKKWQQVMGWVADGDAGMWCVDMVHSQQDIYMVQVYPWYVDLSVFLSIYVQIYREIDLNYDDKISFEEFFLFLFPQHDVCLALEKKRMKILGHRVKQKALKRAV
ncbi:EF-hand domain-containing protein, partial [archaeon]